MRYSEGIGGGGGHDGGGGGGCGGRVGGGCCYSGSGGGGDSLCKVGSCTCSRSAMVKVVVSVGL